MSVSRVIQKFADRILWIPGDSCVSGRVGVRAGIVGGGAGSGIEGVTKADEVAMMAVDGVMTGVGGAVATLIGAAMAVIGC
jgi:hypothetical protein